MDRRYEARLKEMLAPAEVPPELSGGFLARLEPFVQPFSASLDEPEQQRHTVEYLTGLLSKLKHKTGEGMAYVCWGVNSARTGRSLTAWPWAISARMSFRRRIADKGRAISSPRS